MAKWTLEYIVPKQTCHAHYVVACCPECNAYYTEEGGKKWCGNDEEGRTKLWSGFFRNYSEENHEQAKSFALTNAEFNSNAIGLYRFCPNCGTELTPGI